MNIVFWKVGNIKEGKLIDSIILRSFVNMKVVYFDLLYVLWIV